MTMAAMTIVNTEVEEVVVVCYYNKPKSCLMTVCKMLLPLSLFKYTLIQYEHWHSSLSDVPAGQPRHESPNERGLYSLTQLSVQF